MKKNILLSFALLAGLIVEAQQPFMVSIGGGINSPSPALKTKAYLGNGYYLQGDVFIPLSRSNPEKEAGRFAWGIIAGASYYTSKSLLPDTADTHAAYQLYNGSLDITNERDGASFHKGFTASAGLQAIFTWGRFGLSPSFSGGYFSLSQNGFVQRSVADSKPIVLTGVPKTKNSGFTMIPQIRMNYLLTDKLGVYTSAAFQMGPEINTTRGYLVPAGGFNDKQTYEPSQLASGTIAKETLHNNYQALRVNAGLSWSLARKSRKTTTMPSRLSMTPTTARQTQGSTFGEKVNQGLQPAAAKSNNPLYKDKGTATNNPLAGQSKLANPGNPIGGIIVKGGINPGGNLLVVTSNNNGEFELKGLEVGNYQFTLTAPEVSPDESSVGTISGGSGAASASYARKGRTYTGGRKNEAQGKSINEKGVKRSDAAEAARPGSPIGGIVVKGGKNPGGNMTNLTVGSNGEIQFDVLEAGDYKFIIETPKGNNGNENNKEKVIEKASSGLKDTLKTQV
ncbi:MAG: hypothetical protein ACTHLE_03205 [Agriterribacter sp.]